MTEQPLTQTSPQQRLTAWLDRLAVLFRDGLTADRSSVDAAREWLTTPPPQPADVSDPGLWHHGLRHEPVAVGLVILGLVAAIGTTLSTCQELRAAAEKGYLDDVDGIEWVRVAAAVMGRSDVQLQSGQQLFGTVMGLATLTVLGGLLHYYVVILDAGLRVVVRALVIDIFAGIFVVFLVGLLLLPAVGGATAYLYTLFQAAKALR